jgi:hypothetical protein
LIDAGDEETMKHRYFKEFILFIIIAFVFAMPVLSLNSGHIPEK